MVEYFNEIDKTNCDVRMFLKLDELHPKGSLDNQQRYVDGKLFKHLTEELFTACEILIIQFLINFLD